MRVIGSSRSAGFGWIPVRRATAARKVAAIEPVAPIEPADDRETGSRRSRNEPIPWLHGIDLGRPEEAAEPIKREAFLKQRLDAYAKFVGRYDDLDSVIELMLTEARDSTGADGGTFYLDVGHSKLRLTFFQNDTISRAADDMSGVYMGAEIPIDDRSICGYAACLRDIVNVADVAKIPVRAPYKFNRSFDDSSGYRTVSVLAVPTLRADGQLLAVLQLINKIGGKGILPFGDGDVQYARMLASKSMPYLMDALERERLASRRRDLFA